jgi:hypothetical protein
MKSYEQWLCHLRHALGVVALSACVFGFGSNAWLGLAEADGSIRGGSSASGTGSCESLRGEDRAPGKRLKLVWRRVPHTWYVSTDLVGCVPGGPMRTLVSLDNQATNTARGRIVDVAGEIVLVRYLEFDQYDSEREWIVFDVGTGGSYMIAHNVSGALAAHVPSGPWLASSTRTVKRSPSWMVTGSRRSAWPRSLRRAYVTTSTKAVRPTSRVRR